AQNSQNFNDLLIGPTAGGIAHHIVDATPPLRAGSYSGELRLTRLTVDGAHERELTFDVRGRNVERNYGGDSILDLRSVPIYRRGLEDPVNAPASAVNRGEPPPATPTWQVDAGLRVVPRNDLQLLLGVFKVHKAYFSLDAASRYVQLGDISSRGVEGSATLSG